MKRVGQKIPEGRLLALGGRTLVQRFT